MNALFLGLALSLGAPALKDSPSKIIGIWVVESLQTTGKPIKPAGPLRYEFTTDGKWRRYCADHQYGADHKYTLDVKKNPIAIDLITIDDDMEKEVQLGLVHVEDDMMTLCLNRSGDRRPTEIKAGPNSSNRVYVLKRLKPKE